MPELKETRQIMLDDLRDFMKELDIWHQWLVLNDGAFSSDDVAPVLKIAREIVNELLFAELDE